MNCEAASFSYGKRRTGRRTYIKGTESTMSVAKKMYTPYPIEVNIWGVNRVMMKLMDVSEVSR
jgi:uncharacterized protein YaaQ